MNIVGIVSLLFILFSFIVGGCAYAGITFVIGLIGVIVYVMSGPKWLVD